MNNVIYLEEINKVWQLIEERVEQADLDIDCYTIGSVFTVETADKQQVIINRQEPKQELWLASVAGASHYVFKNDQWINTADGKSFWYYCDQAFAAIQQPKLFSDLYHA